ncbi:MAG: zinc ribbon domain-containing protein [Chloroflexota bacterium]
MPIYEYKCDDCKRKVNLFFGSFNVAEQRIAAGEIQCTNCGSKKLARLMSRVNVGRSEEAFAEDSMPDMGGMGGMGGMLDGLEDDDPRTVARWARRMKDNLAEDIDMGPDFDMALARIESGEDPDKVMEDMDPDALNNLSGMGGVMDDDYDSADDFGPESIGL